MSASATALVALILLCRRDMFRSEDVRTARAISSKHGCSSSSDGHLPRTSSAGERSEQSSSRSETSPGFGAVDSDAVMYSTDLLSSTFCERSRNWRASDWTPGRVSSVNWMTRNLPWPHRLRSDDMNLLSDVCWKRLKETRASPVSGGSARLA
jgi:hypothetical protein